MTTLEISTLVFDQDGVPVSQAYGDVYHSKGGGLGQACHVFLAGNGLPARWQGHARFCVLETGFGLGLNFLATWRAWRDDPLACGELQFVSLEKHPFSVDDLFAAQHVWTELSDLASELRALWPPLTAGEHRLRLAGGRVILRLVFGDAVDLLPTLDACVDAFYLDGFSPAKNPELWSPELCRSLARLARPGATLATWSVAGHVRRALTGAGFEVARREGFAGKRHMLAGRFRAEPG